MFLLVHPYVNMLMCSRKLKGTETGATVDNSYIPCY